MIVAATGSLSAAYLLAGVLLLLSAGMTLITKAPEKEIVPVRPLFRPSALTGGVFFNHILKRKFSRETIK